MTKQEYVKAMTYMGVMFNKPVGKDVIEVWYEFLATVPEITFKNAIKQLALKTKFLPGLQEIMDMCSEVQSKQNNSILQLMYEDGYFHKSDYGEIDADHAFRNYEKALMWINKGIRPEWLLEDMIAYGYKASPRIESSKPLQLENKSD